MVYQDPYARSGKPEEIPIETTPSTRKASDVPVEAPGQEPDGQTTSQS